MITNTKIKSLYLLITLTFSCATPLYGIWPFNSGQEDFVGLFQPLLNEEKTTLSNLKLKLDRHAVSGELVIIKTSLFSSFFSLLAKEFTTLGHYLSSMTGQTIELESLAQEILLTLPVRSLAEVEANKIPDQSSSSEPSPYQIDTMILTKDKRICTKISRVLTLHISKLTAPLNGNASKFDIIGRLALCNAQLLRSLVDLFQLIEEEYSLYAQSAPKEFQVLDFSPVISQLEYISNLQSTINYERQSEMQSLTMSPPTRSWLTTLPSAPQLLIVLGAIGTALFLFNRQLIAPTKVKMARAEADGKSYVDSKIADLKTERNETLESITSQIETLLDRQEQIDKKLPEVLAGLSKHLEEEHLEERDGNGSRRYSVDYSPKSPRGGSLNLGKSLAAGMGVTVPEEKTRFSWLHHKQSKKEKHTSWAPSTAEDKSEEVEEEEEEPHRLKGKKEKKKTKNKKGHRRRGSDSMTTLPPYNSKKS